MSLVATIVLAIIISLLAALVLSTLTYSLRDYSKARLEGVLISLNRAHWLEPIIRHTADLVFITACLRLLASIFALLGILRLFAETGWQIRYQYTAAVIVFTPLGLFFSVAVPSALAKHLAEPLLAYSSHLLHGLYLLFSPITWFMHTIERMVVHTTSPAAPSEAVAEAAVEEEILAAVEEGEKSGIVGEAEREMIESVIQFRDATAGQIMTPRKHVIALKTTANLQETLDLIERSGHSRLPVYQQDLDHISGIFYARDLLHQLADGALAHHQFDLSKAIRPVFFVPETKPLRDLLQDFRLQKIHIAVVLDEFGGTAGIVTIEDVLEELVGDISDEHEPTGQAMVSQTSDGTWEADATIYVEELNRIVGLNIPEDQGYDTLAGFVAHVAGQIPRAGFVIEQPNARFTVVTALPQRVQRVKIELLSTTSSIT
jgi:CBS domain containing-hemolysin-like protein